MYPTIVLCSLLLATSATARPDLLRRDSAFLEPRELGGYPRNPRVPADGAEAAAQSAASASAAVAAVSASAATAATIDTYSAWSASAASAQYARGESQMLVVSAMLASEAAQSSIVIQNKLVDPAATSVAPPSISTPSASAQEYGFAFYAAARYKHEDS